MPQHDMVIDNQAFPAFRADMILAFKALVSQNQGSSAPSATFSYMPWLDTSATPWVMKIRNAANDAWITTYEIDDSDNTWNVPLATSVDIADAGGHYSGTEVEAALQEAAVITQGQHTIWIPAGAMTARTTVGAAFGSIETSTNKVMGESLDFSTAQDEFIQFAIQMPKGWNEGTLIFQIVFSHPSTTTNFGVVFFMQAVAFANSDALDAAFGTAVSVTDTGGTTNDIFISPESAAITVAGSPGAEEYVIFQVYRDVSAGGDTLAVDARLHGVKIHYTTTANTDS